ncbi:PDZ domain-containing protein [Chitinimonas arctica]|uniref:Tricorn protease homolog n=1 Tax=Chitinimonas arctica TaxID=2594795 RepID=A0A516SFH9_9NEIS|nr:DPP IV N-terminal domain-containing protein [Chitinimonas arctica]QDQ26903.1 PDZ domain-containing protein [Chitinimonas arctica]
MRLACLLATLPLFAQAAPLLYEPAVSPDGRTVAFVSGGDIWTVPADGGEARLLIAHPAAESRPQWSPDGRKLVFTSNRSGNGDLYLLDLDNNSLRRLTHDDRPEQASGWSPDSHWIYFHSVSHDIQRMHDVYRVAAGGGTPMPVLAQRYLDESQASPSPDGQWLALNARGFGQWWRRGGAHIDQDELWLAPASGKGAWRRLATEGARAAWPMWSADSRALWFVGNPGGQENLYRQSLAGKPEQISQFKQGRLLWPSLSANGQVLVFEREFALWRLDTASGESRPLHVKLNGSGAAPAGERLSLGDKLEEAHLSPDGKQLAFVAHGDIWLAPASGGSATRLTRSAAAESQLDWSPDSQSLAYVSLRNGPAEVWHYRLADKREVRLTQVAGDAFPRFSPDGKQIAYLRNGQQLRLVEPATGQDKLLSPVQTGRPPIWADAPLAWAPDGHAIAVVELGHKLLANVALIPLAGGSKQMLSQLASPGTGKKLWFRPEEQGYGQASLQWRADGRVLWWRAFQHSENGGRVVEISLAPPAPLGMDGEAGKTAPWQLDAAWARRHAVVLPTGLDSQYFVAAADGKTLLMLANLSGQTNVWRYRAGETPRQLSFSSGTKHFLQLEPQGRELFYLDAGKLLAVPVEGGTPRPIILQADMEVDFEAEKQAVFEEGWQLLRDFFYDPAMHGQDWAALKARFAPLLAEARSRDEMRRVIWLMIGELDSSHTGLSAPRSETPTTLGRLGLDFDRAVYERDGKLQLAAVLEDGPAAAAGLATGDILLAVDGETLVRDTNLDRLLEGKIGRLTTLSVLGRDGKTQVRYAKPFPYAEENILRYKQWVAGNRATVQRTSKGKLDYIHLIDMRESSLEQFHYDLDAVSQAASGVVIDARNNFGGMVDSWELDTLARKSHYSFTARQLPTAPGRLAVGQQTLEKPTVLLTNKITLSDGEVFTEGYRAMKLGKVVGEPGAGWVIFTSFKVLVDGSTLRLPFSRVLSTLNGDDLEAGPRPVDIAVPANIGEGETDAQLMTAIKVLAP